MPFLNPDSPFFFSKRPRGVKAWLRAIIVEDLGLKLLALAITFFLWFSITGQRTPVTVPLRHIPLSFRYASDLEIIGETREVEVTVTGSKTELDHLNINELVAVVDVSNFGPGERVVRLNRTNVTMNLPDGIQLGEVEPKSVPVHLEPRIQRQLVVVPKLTGKPAAGFEVHAVTVDPAAVQIRGAVTRVNAVAQADTEPLSIEGLRADRVFQEAAVTISDPKLSLIDTVVNVTVHVGEVRVERTLAGVIVRGADNSPARPSTATVVVYGDKSVVEALHPGDLQLVLDPVAGAAPKMRLTGPPTLDGRVEIRSTKPAEFSLAK